MSIPAWLELLLAATGVTLLLLGGYLYFKQWSHFNVKTGVYKYMSKRERDRRSLKAGFAAALFMFGVVLTVPVFVGPMPGKSIIFLLLLGLCPTPMLILAAALRMRKDLEPYTKMEEDVVFLDEDTHPKK